MATVVDLSKGTSYKLLALVTNLFMWCMSGVPHVLDSKTCAHDELIRVVHVCCAICVFDGKMCARDEHIHVMRHVVDG